MATSTRQTGFTLVEVMLALVISTLIGVYALHLAVRQSHDLAATATAQYLKTVRGAVVDALSRHYEAFHLIDTTNAPPGIYESAPDWTEFAGATQTISLQPLLDSGFLPNNFSPVPPLGGSTRITFVRSGTCPGADCQVDAYLWTCLPISAQRSRADTVPADCTLTAAQADSFDPALLSRLLEESEGLGAANFFDTTLRGPLFSVTNTQLGAPETLGRFALVASLNQTHLNQFVRQGDTRHVHLRNALTVENRIASRTGLLLETAIASGTACDSPGLLALTANGVLAQCVGNAGVGSWLELTRHVVRVQGLYANGALIPSPNCPTTATPFVHLATASTDFTIPGTDITVRGDLDGSVTGTGSVNSTGSVNVTGTVTGELLSRLDSQIKIRQLASTTGPANGPWTVNLTPADANARAFAVAGCILG